MDQKVCSSSFITEVRRKYIPDWLSSSFFPDLWWQLTPVAVPFPSSLTVISYHVCTEGYFCLSLPIRSWTLPSFLMPPFFFIPSCMFCMPCPNRCESRPFMLSSFIFFIWLLTQR